jgi:alpha-mannosidase
MSAEKELFLICNSHIDPVWLWNWEEGLAETLATFRLAARFCEEFPGFVFCHNEALLYEWVEEHDPGLFQQIQALVAARRWHIMGGWYLQPDCNLPAGESLVRQILTGKKYFRDKFAVEPTVAVNLDPFGHARGLVQILRKSGYRGYLFCRPDQGKLPLTGPDFIWCGHDSTSLIAHRPPDHYNSEMGKAALKIRNWLAANQDRAPGLLLWGIGNHGGGPSRQDLEQIAALQSGTKDRRIMHATPEDYFDRLQERANGLPQVSTGLNPWGVGCYTSMARVKNWHRRLENALFSAERIATDALLQLDLAYPRAELGAALRALLFCEFHDALAGSSIPEVEEGVLQKLSHGLEILAQIRMRIFLKLLAGQPEAPEGEFPIFVHNPHPHEGDETIVCEFQPREPNFDKSVFWQPELCDEDGRMIPVQLEKESCNILADQRKRIVFTARLRPSSIQRFSCRLRNVAPRDPRALPAVPAPEELCFQNEVCSVEIGSGTGLIDAYSVRGVAALNSGAFRPMVMRDSADPWGMRVRSFRDLAGEFRLMTPAEAAAFAAVDSDSLPPVRIIERGTVRTVVEALFIYGFSRLCMRYKIPNYGTEVEIEARVFWEEKDRMLKLSIPTAFTGGKCLVQSCYAVDEHAADGEEKAAHAWLAVQSADSNHALTIVNDRTYGFDCLDGELRLSLLRAPGYAGHPVDDGPIVRQDRFETRIDQGEHRFRFWLNCGPARERLAQATREASWKNDPCFALCAFPSGEGSRPLPGLQLSNPAVQAGAWKLAEDGRNLILRLFETTGRPQKVTVHIPALAMEFALDLRPFELRSLAINPSAKSVDEVDLLERPL